ncbi:MAG: flavoprotein [Candidatus Omnitrophota bacterium]|nr:hypothetical protein [Candidatus Omnitrophota bacterium]MBU2528591.1 hypothetical protein [bacterium]MBU3930529.1 hypothetical protein [bacterium]MBU4123246.1 hypothetical protein [bacterium]
MRPSRTKSKNILLGVCSSAACFKALTLASALVKKGHAVKTVLSPSAAKLISPQLFGAVTKNEAFSEQFNPSLVSGDGHISLSDWADFYVIAPATANTIGKLASGICDNLLLTLAVSRRGALFIAPAMESRMWQNGFVGENVSKLKKSGVKFIGPVTGRLASGSTGPGRMSEAEDIIKKLPL